MLVAFLGGPLDGELREVRIDSTTTVTAASITKTLMVPEEYRCYFFGNGIARHESVSEEEVARRVREWLGCAIEMGYTP